MRKTRAYLLAALLVLVVTASLALAACGDAKSAAQAGPTTPEGILNQAMTAASPMDNGTGQFDLTIAINGDTAQMPAELKAMFAEPITITGTMTGSQDPLALDLAITASLGGQDLPLGMKMVDGKAYVQLMGVWYETPAELMSAMSTPTTDQKTTVDSMMQMLKTAGIDPMTWLSGLTLVGEDDLDGTKAYHLSGNVDVTKMFTDAMNIAQDEELLNSLSGAMDDAGTAPTLPDAAGMEELQTMQSELAGMFPEFTVDVWITKDGYQLRKGSMSAKMVPPPGEDMQGINDISLKANFSFAPTDSPVKITPPAGAKPASELEEALGLFEGLFSGFMGG